MPNEEIQQPQGPDGPDLSALREAASNVGFGPEGSTQGSAEAPHDEAIPPGAKEEWIQPHEGSGDSTPETAAGVGEEVVKHAGVEEPENHEDPSEKDSEEQLQRELKEARENWRSLREDEDALESYQGDTKRVVGIYEDLLPDSKSEAEQVANQYQETITGALNEIRRLATNAADRVLRLEEDLEGVQVGQIKKGLSES